MAAAGCNSAASALAELHSWSSGLRLRSPRQRRGFSLWVPPPKKVKFPRIRTPPVPSGLPTELSPGPCSPYRTALRGRGRESKGSPPYLGELNLQVADGARQCRLFPIRLSIFHSPVSGGHGWSALHGPRSPSPRRTGSAWAVRSLLRVTAPRLYAAPHASRPRGPPNWLQEGRAGAGGEEGTRPPPQSPLPLSLPLQEQDGPGLTSAAAGSLCALQGGHAAGFCSPGGCPSASSESDFRAGNSQDSDTSKGRELAGSDRGNRPLSRGTCGPCCCPTLAGVSARAQLWRE